MSTSSLLKLLCMNTWAVIELPFRQFRHAVSTTPQIENIRLLGVELEHTESHFLAHSATFGNLSLLSCHHAIGSVISSAVNAALPA
jgi:hypothetical protein